ncbi:LysR family transcriptional regulator [Paraburkholderia phosphatilytica]|uniref:LysR family transcriptional regulator n=1 Tax=Paraburkholderia phosphatilytica TaxID=2282883 RepID=UPI0013DEF21E|nr:LysR family transcriptional regulator [Paraburkholderia phosphatilytica]
MLERSDLAMVLAIKETGSLIGAARRLGVSGAAITKRLAQVEAVMAVRLFRRTTRSVVPTPEGDLYCELAMQVLAGFASLESRVADFSTTPVGLVRLACNMGFGRQWLAPIVDGFSRRYPSVRVELYLTNRLPDLQAEGFDAAVWLWQPSTTRWIVQTLAKNNRVMVASHAYLQEAGTPRNLDDLRNHTCLLMLERDMPANIWRLSRVGPQASEEPIVDVRVSGVLSSNHGEVLRDWALSGAGIALRPYWDVQAHIQQGALVHVLSDYAKVDSDVQWIAPYRPHLPERVKLLKEFIELRLRDAAWIA